MSFKFLFQIQGLSSALRPRVPLHKHQARVKGVLSINKGLFFSFSFSFKLNFINICLKKPLYVFQRKQSCKISPNFRLISSKVLNTNNHRTTSEMAQRSVFYYNLSNCFLYKKLRKKHHLSNWKNSGVKELKGFHWKLTKVIKDSGNPQSRNSTMIKGNST